MACAAAAAGMDPCQNVRSRLKPIHQEERRVQLKLFTFSQILNPQPRAKDVVHALLSWINAADAASQCNEEKPPFVRANGNAIFPDNEDWRLANIEQRKHTRFEYIRLLTTLQTTTLQI